MSILYTARASANKGRQGRAYSDDDRLDVQLSTPAALGGDDGPGTNPEQLFAAGYAACFMSAMGLVAQQAKIKLPDDSKVDAEVGIGPREAGGFGLEVTLIAHLPGVDEAQANELLEKTEQVCPYSNATRGNVTITLKLG
ncbi:organic hydroperoxide resistance protein [Oceanicaulis alexandrii]|uniref:organic hydroperoxide resistance protein n=1 Tax=Oceanicaulis alexandrii TaxID=153233 RepID=UPI0035CE9CFF